MAQPVQAVFAESPQSQEAPGLSSSEARRRLRRSGPNELFRGRDRSLAHKLGASMLRSFALVLGAAGAVAFVSRIPWIATAIVAAAAVSAALAFVRERRVLRAAEKLGGLLASRALVQRDGRWAERDARELVVGDVVSLAMGDRVCADLFIWQADELCLDASVLEGESTLLFVKGSGAAFAGTTVIAGSAIGTVVATGARTRLAGIAGCAR